MRTTCGVKRYTVNTVAVIVTVFLFDLSNQAMADTTGVDTSTAGINTTAAGYLKDYSYLKLTSDVTVTDKGVSDGYKESTANIVLSENTPYVEVSAADSNSQYSLAQTYGELRYKFMITGTPDTDVPISVSSKLGFSYLLDDKAINSYVYGVSQVDISNYMGQILYHNLVIETRLGSGDDSTRFYVDGDLAISSNAKKSYSIFEEYIDTVIVKTNTIYTIFLGAQAIALDAQMYSLSDPYIDIVDNSGAYSSFQLIFSDGVNNLPSNFSPAPVPEPASMLLFGMGAASLASITRRKKLTF